MAQSTTVLNQLLSLVPKKIFNNLAELYRVDYKASIFRAQSHFAVLVYAQLVGLKSLRDIVHATSGLFSYHREGGLVSVKRSTLADANRRVDYHFYRDLFFAILDHHRHLFKKHTFPLPGKLFTLDSTKISVCLKQFPWAVFRKGKGAFKLHTLIDNDGIIPADIVMTDGKVHDIRPARDMEIHPKATYLVDRAYVDSSWLYNIHQTGAYFVSRWKINVGFVWSESYETGNSEGVLGEWIGKLDGTSGKHFPELLRVVRYIDPETKKELWFLTNLMDVEAQTVADLYKHRWQIELFFKWIKQNLKIKSFLGTSENAVLTQIWVAMIAYLLLQTQKAQLNTGVTTHQLLIYVRIFLMLKQRKALVWQGIDKTIKESEYLELQQTRRLLTMTGH